MQSKNVVMLDVVYAADKQQNNNDEYFHRVTGRGGGSAIELTDSVPAGEREKAEL